MILDGLKQRQKRPRTTLNMIFPCGQNTKLICKPKPRASTSTGHICLFSLYSNAFFFVRNKTKNRKNNEKNKNKQTNSWNNNMKQKFLISRVWLGGSGGRRRYAFCCNEMKRRRNTVVFSFVFLICPVQNSVLFSEPIHNALISARQRHNKRMQCAHVFTSIRMFSFWCARLFAVTSS